MNIRSITLLLAGIFGLNSLAARADCLPAADLECLTQSLLASMSAVTEPKSWITGAVEASHAAAATQNRERAATLLGEAIERARGLEAPDDAARSLAEVAQAGAELNFDRVSLRASEIGLTRTLGVVDPDVRTDLTSRLLVAIAHRGQPALALTGALALPQDSDNQASYKARTLRAVATQNDARSAQRTLPRITMGLSYYQSVAYADVARRRLADGAAESITPLLNEAVRIARAQTDGYFVAGALREAAAVYQLAGQVGLAGDLMADAVEASRGANTPQHRARALSRIATELADLGRHVEARALLPEAIKTAAGEEQELLRHWTHYEIAGSAAFAGDVNQALALLGQIPADAQFGTSILQDSAARDVAWGLARHGHWERAIDVVETISSPLPKVQALARLIRLKVDPGMAAYSRYL